MTPEPLAHSLSMLRATLEATTDAILVVDGRGKVTGFNERFVEMGRFPPEVMGSDAETGMLDVILSQLKDPEQFLSKVKELYAHPEAESFDVLDFKDGRSVERYSRAQRIEDRVVGRVWSFRDVTARKAAEAELHFKTAFLEAQINSSLDGILLVDGLGKKLAQNQRLNDLWKIPGHIAEDTDDQKQIEFVMHQVKSSEAFVEKIVHLYAHPSESSRDEVELTDGTVLDRYSYPVVGADGTHYGRIWSFRDVTERRRFEERLREAQKVEAVGRLAGGIAHDFNNILAIIQGEGELLAREVGGSDAALDRLDQIGRATERAATLTRQLLAFGRKQVLQPRRLDLNAVVSELEPTLRGILGQGVSLVINAAPGPVVVRADAGQIEHVIMNLAMNSREAMPEGGRLVLETAIVDLATGYASQHPDVTPDSYAMLAVSDTGTGMDAETRSHIFEPFFTTKSVGQATGFGLPAVHGIVSQSKGHIDVESAPGRGSTFRVYLPRLDHEAGDSVGAKAVPERKAGGVILLVDDEPALNDLNCEVLRDVGYEVLAAGSGAQALDIAAKREGPIDLLLSDVVMAGQSGTELAACLLATRPETKILYMSGYGGDDLVERGLDEAVAGFIQKPFSPDALAQKVRGILDS